MNKNFIVLKSPLEIYHQNHTKTEALNRPMTEWNLNEEVTKKMKKTNKPLIINCKDGVLETKY